MILDEKEKYKEIPYNLENNFEIKKSIKWNYSIDINIYKNKEINLFNLYKILKKYIDSKIIPVYQILLVLKKEEREIVSTSFKKIEKFFNNFNEFKNWYNFEINEIWKYEELENKNSPIGFRILFNKKIVKDYEEKKKINILDIYKPLFDWTENDEKDLLYKIENIIKKSENMSKEDIILELEKIKKDLI